MNIPKGNHKLGEIEIIKEVQIYKNNYLTINNDDVIFPKGNEGTYFRISSKNNLSVGILPISKNGKLMLLKNYRHAVRGWGYEMPKGEVGLNEAPNSAALRELNEEAGIIPKRLVYIGEYYESPAIYSVKMKCYVALDCEQSAEKNIENTEAISGTFEISIDDYLSKEKTLDFKDALTELIVLKYLSNKQTNE